MNEKNIKKAFDTCEFPFYKDLKIKENKAEWTLYSIKSNYRTMVTLDLSSYEKLLHQISIELIKLRSHELLENQSVIDQAENIAIKLD